MAKRGRPRKPLDWKPCPRCGTIHSKPGKFCSRSCANVRVISESQRIAISEANTIFSNSDHPNAKKRKKNLKQNQPKSTAKKPPEKPLGIEAIREELLPPEQEEQVVYIGGKEYHIDDEGVPWEVVGGED